MQIQEVGHILINGLSSEVRVELIESIDSTPITGFLETLNLDLTAIPPEEGGTLWRTEFVGGASFRFEHSEIPTAFERIVIHESIPGLAETAVVLCNVLFLEAETDPFGTYSCNLVVRAIGAI